MMLSGHGVSPLKAGPVSTPRHAYEEETHDSLTSKTVSRADFPQDGWNSGRRGRAMRAGSEWLAGGCGGRRRSGDVALPPPPPRPRREAERNTSTRRPRDHDPGPRPGPRDRPARKPGSGYGSPGRPWAAFGGRRQLAGPTVQQERLEGRPGSSETARSTDHCFVRDSQSDFNRSAQVASDLILNDKVSLIGASSSAANVIPVRDTAEALECPGVHYDVPGDAWAEGKSKEGDLKWNWCAWWVGKDLVENFVKMWGLVTNNRRSAHVGQRADGMGLRQRYSTGTVTRSSAYKLIDPVARWATEDFGHHQSVQRRKAWSWSAAWPTRPEVHQLRQSRVRSSPFQPPIVHLCERPCCHVAVEALGDLAIGNDADAAFHFLVLNVVTPQRPRGRYLRCLRRHRNTVDARHLLPLGCLRAEDRWCPGGPSWTSCV